MTTAEAARYLGISRATVWRYVRGGAIPACEERNPLNTRRIYRIERAEVEAAARRIAAGEQLITPGKSGRPRKQD
jgi:excisionase family DNA binding protein